MYASLIVRFIALHTVSDPRDITMEECDSGNTSKFTEMVKSIRLTKSCCVVRSVLGGGRVAAGRLLCADSFIDILFYSLTHHYQEFFADDFGNDGKTILGLSDNENPCHLHNQSMDPNIPASCFTTPRLPAMPTGGNTSGVELVRDDPTCDQVMLFDIDTGEFRPHNEGIIPQSVY